MPWPLRDTVKWPQIYNFQQPEGMSSAVARGCFLYGDTSRGAESARTGERIRAIERAIMHRQHLSHPGTFQHLPLTLLTRSCFWNISQQFCQFEV